MLKRFLVVPFTLLSVLASVPANASDFYVTVRVTTIEATYLPSFLQFQIDSPAGSCAAGSWLYWTIQGSTETQRNINVQGVYSLLVTALASGRQILIAGTNSGCSVEYIHLK